MSDALTFTDEVVQRCPFPVYEKLRDEKPVYRDPVNGHYVLTRYDDIRKALLNFKELSNRTGMMGDRWCEKANKVFKDRGWLPMDTLVSNDRPEHSWYRGLVNKVFTNQKVKSLEPRISEIINGLIDEFPESGEVDFLDAFAVPLPMYVIAEQLGVSTKDRRRFKLWSDAATESTFPGLTDERQVELAEILVDMQRYMANEIQRVQEEPDDYLLSQLVHVESDGRKLNLQELQSLLLQLLVAGNETTTTTLSSCMKALIEQPELVDELHSNPDGAQAFSEEVLRTATPFQTLFRRTLQEVEISNVVIPEDAIVEVRFGAANHDPKQFECPANIDLARENTKSHLAFGAGIHMCIGNQLARSELTLACEILTQRLKNFKASRGDNSFVQLQGYHPYGLRVLWMSFERR